VRIVVAHECLQRRNLAAKVCDHHEPVCAFCERDADCGMSRGNEIVGRNDDRRVASHRQRYLTSSSLV
jgi:hypothetical protein